MHFLSEKLESYIERHTEDEPELLRKLTRETYLKVVHPRMITGHHQGRLLSMLSKIIAPKNILEIGTYTGYSTICLAEGLRENGLLQTIEINEELRDMQHRYFDQSGFGDRIITHIGDAIKIIPELDTEFDLVFIDGKKADYLDYWNVVYPKTKKGGVILVDNVLWSGKVTQRAEKNDEATSTLQEFNKMLKESDEVEVVILPVRDGLSLCRVL